MLGIEVGERLRWLAAAGFVSFACACASETTAVSGSGSGGSVSATSGAGGAGDMKVVTLHPKAAPLPGEKECVVVETLNIPEPNFEHIDVCSPLDYPSPPSGGNHWPIWAHWGKATTPIPREMYVHNLEHGGVVFTFHCKGVCPDVLDAFDKVFASFQTDPICAESNPGVKARLVITADAKLDTPIAISAWGNTYAATCIDPDSIHAFAHQVYGHGREPLCIDGYDLPLCALP